MRQPIIAPIALKHELRTCGTCEISAKIQYRGVGQIKAKTGFNYDPLIDADVIFHVLRGW